MPVLRPALCAALGMLAAAAPAQVRFEDWSPGSAGIAERMVVPPAYRGLWATDAVLCADEGGEGRIRITDRGLDGYESGGRLLGITPAGRERAVRVSMVYDGEGASSNAVEIWSLDERGNRLIVAQEDGVMLLDLARCATGSSR